MFANGWYHGSWLRTKYFMLSAPVYLQTSTIQLQPISCQVARLVTRGTALLTHRPASVLTVGTWWVGALFESVHMCTGCWGMYEGWAGSLQMAVHECVICFKHTHVCEFRYLVARLLQLVSQRSVQLCWSVAASVPIAWLSCWATWGLWLVSWRCHMTSMLMGYVWIRSSFPRSRASNLPLATLHLEP